MHGHFSRMQGNLLAAEAAPRTPLGSLHHYSDSSGWLGGRCPAPHEPHPRSQLFGSRTLVHLASLLTRNRMLGSFQHDGQAAPADTRFCRLPSWSGISIGRAQSVSCLYPAHPCVQDTDPKDHATCDVCSKAPHLLIAYMWHRPEIDFWPINSRLL